MMSDTWETFCDESYYHMWCLRKIGQRGFNDGFHINNRDEAIVLCDLLNKMERELAEAKFDLQFRRELYALQTKELGEAREQRDRLAEALQEALEDHTQAGCISIETQQVAEAALAAVKGGIHE
jgi:hypothetical protein